MTTPIDTARAILADPTGYTADDIRDTRRDLFEHGGQTAAQLAAELAEMLRDRTAADQPEQSTE